jgi:hypothetical protein
MYVDKLVEGVLDNTVAVELLTDEELELVFDRIQECAESLIGTEHHEAAEAVLAALSVAIDNRLVATDMSVFEQAIVAAEARGSVYWEFDEYTLH